jgi:hypothetical protein
MDNPRRQAVLTAAAMILIAIFVLFVLPPAANDSEKAFRLRDPQMAPRPAGREWAAMIRRGRAPLVVGLACIGLGVLAGLAVRNPPLRYAVSLTALALGFGLLRRAFRVD